MRRAFSSAIPGPRRSVPPGARGGRPPETAIGEILITRPTDTISATLFKFSTSSQPFTLRVDFLKQGAKGYDIFLQLTCRDTLISSYSISSGRSVSAEAISFNFTEINYTTIAIDHPGKTAMIRRSVESYNNLA